MVDFDLRARRLVNLDQVARRRRLTIAPGVGGLFRLEAYRRRGCGKAVPLIASLRSRRRACLTASVVVAALYLRSARRARSPLQSRCTRRLDAVAKRRGARCIGQRLLQRRVDVVRLRHRRIRWSLEESEGSAGAGDGCAGGSFVDPAYAGLPPCGGRSPRQ
jgi:hypothetical protein